MFVIMFLMSANVYKVKYFKKSTLSLNSDIISRKYEMNTIPRLIPIVLLVLWRNVDINRLILNNGKITNNGVIASNMYCFLSKVQDIDNPI